MTKAMYAQNKDLMSGKPNLHVRAENSNNKYIKPHLLSLYIFFKMLATKEKNKCKYNTRRQNI